jgi:hypothetical protein
MTLFKNRIILDSRQIFAQNEEQTVKHSSQIFRNSALCNDLSFYGPLKNVKLMLETLFFSINF